MADPPQPVTEHIFEPAGVRTQLGPPEAYPYLFSFTGEDGLEVTSWNVVAGVRVTLQGRIHVAPGQVVPFLHSHTPNSDRTAKTTIHTMPRGELLNLIAYCDAGEPLHGQTFLRVAVRRGLGAAHILLGVLLQGPVTAECARAFPGSPIVAMGEGNGYYRTITGTAPGAGNQIIETVPTYARWQLLGLLATLTTTAAAVTRHVHISYHDGNVIGVAPATAVAPASTATLFAWQAGLALDSNLAKAGAVFSGLPYPLTLGEGADFNLNVENQQGGDTWSAPAYRVLEWLDV